MAREANRILAINPGTRYLGLAVFVGPELMDWRIKTFKGKWSKAKLEKILDSISGIIELYEPDALAVKKLHPSRSSKNLRLLVSGMKAMAQRKKIKVYQYLIKELEDFLIEEGKLNKRNLAEKIIKEYPMLVHELNKEKSRKHSYYMRTIEAVALGIMVKS